MNTTRYITYIIFFLTLFSCGQSKQNEHPDIMKPEWADIGNAEAKLKTGDLMSINTSNKSFFGIVMDRRKDEKGIWYGVCLSKAAFDKQSMSRALFFGRKIPSGLAGKNCVECFDLIYLHESLAGDGMTVSGNVELNRNLISVGSHATAMNIAEVERYYQFSITQRLKRTFECDEDVLGLNRVPEKYMNLEEVLLK